jgi:hypothetical protein
MLSVCCRTSLLDENPTLFSSTADGGLQGLQDTAFLLGAVGANVRTILRGLEAVFVQEADVGLQNVRDVNILFIDNRVD